MSSVVYYPSCVCHFRIRFDEAFSIREAPPGGDLDEAPLDEFLRQERNQRSNGDDARAGPRPLFVDNGSDDNLSYVLGRVPKSASIELPGFRQAGKFNMSVAWADLPIDPRLIRAMSVEIHLGTVRDDDFAAGMAQRGHGVRRSQLDTRDVNGESRTDTLLMVGVVDDHDVEHNDGKSVVTLEGRDLRGVLLDSPVTATQLQNINTALDRPIDEVVIALLEVARHPLAARLVVETNPFEWPNATLPSPAVRGGLTRVRRGNDGQSAQSSGAGGSDSQNLWDMITRYCQLVGAIPYFEGYVLRIRPSRSLYDINRNPNGPTPFAGHQPREVDGERLRIRRMVYGDNIQTLKFSRKQTGQRGRTVECVGVDTSRRGDNRLLVAAWPQNENEARQSLAQLSNNQRTTDLFAGTAGPTVSVLSNRRAQTSARSPHGEGNNETLRITVPGVTDIVRLREIARSIFEEVMRGEMGGSVKTRELASFGGGNADPDLVRLRPGDPVEIAIDTRSATGASPLVSTYTDFAREPFDKMVRLIADRIGDTNLARAIVATARDSIAELQRFFITSNVKYTWDGEKGVTIEFDFQNYVEARLNTSATPTTQGSTAPQRTVGRPRARRAPAPHAGAVLSPQGRLPHR